MTTLAGLALHLKNAPFAMPAHRLSVFDSLLAGGLAGKPRSAGAPKWKSTSATYGVVPLYGMIFQRPNMLTENGLGTPLDSFFIPAVKQFAADPSVNRIILDIDSDGGQVAGMDEAADAVAQAAKSKPVIAVANSEMIAGAYWIASAASEVVVTPNGQAGGIGIAVMHVDQSAFNKAIGAAVTLIKAGEKKTAGNPYAPLDSVGREELGSMVEDFYRQFTRTVARGRKTTQTAIRETDGSTYRAEGAVKAGLADRIASFEQVLREGPRGSKGSSASSTRPDPVALAQLQRRAAVTTPPAKKNPEVATHEAAHAVVAVRLNYRLLGASILSDATSAGRVSVDYTRPDLPAHEANYNRAVIAYAGHFGELLEDPWRIQTGIAADVKNAEAAMPDVTMRGFAADHAKRLVNESAAAVRAVADALRVHHQLSHADVAAIVARYPA